MYYNKKYYVFIFLLIEIQLNACQVEDITAPNWICNEQNQYKNYITSIGIAEKLDLEMRIVKKLAIAYARVELAHILKAKVSSNIFNETNSHNNNYEKKFISTIHVSVKEKVKNYKILETWESPRNLYVLVGINKIKS